MKNLLTAVLLSIVLTSQAQVRLQSSLIFTSESQNRMASNIPALLLEAFRKGDIDAYYPQALDTKIPYTQFLNHFGEGKRAQVAMAAGPSWFCSSEPPKPGKTLIDCLSKKIEILESAQKKVFAIRLIHDQGCDPRAMDTYGPVFKASDISKLDRTRYFVTNPQNEAVKYSIYDLLQLRLFFAR